MSASPEQGKCSRSEPVINKSQSTGCWPHTARHPHTFCSPASPQSLQVQRTPETSNAATVHKEKGVFHHHPGSWPQEQSNTATHHSWGRSLQSTTTSCILWHEYFLHTKINTAKGKPQEKVKLNITSGFANTFLCLLIKPYPVVTTMPGRWGCWLCLHFPDTKLRMKSHSKSHTTLSWFSWELN